MRLQLILATQKAKMGFYLRRFSVLFRITAPASADVPARVEGCSTFGYPVSCGSSAHQYTVNSAGKWTIAATYNGTSTTASSKSNSLSVQTQPQPKGLTLALYGFIIAIVAAGIGAFALVRKGSGTKTSTSLSSKP
jgi:hypothetical protein